MDAYSIGFVFGAVFGFVAALTFVIVKCLTWVPKSDTGQVKVFSQEQIKKNFREDDKHKVFRPFELR